MDSVELAFERLHQRQMQFLQNASPDDWHRYADNHNWNDRLDGLFWIVSQPDCDRATAMLTFWKGEPACYDFETEDEKMGEDEYGVAPMLRYIAERFNTTGYPRSEIAYDCLEDHGLNFPEYAAMGKAGRQADIKAIIERQQDIADPLVKLHPDLQLLRISGRKVGGYADKSDYYALFPDQVDDEGSEPSDTVAPRPQNFVPAAPSDASSRIRALRREGGASSEDAASPWLADRPSAASRDSDESEADAGLSAAMFDAFGLIVNMAGVGFWVGFAPKHLTTHTASPLFWVAAIVGIAYCSYAVFSNFRKMQRGVAALGLVIVPSWITTTTTIATLSGIGVGRTYLALLDNPAVTSFTRYGFMTAAGIGLLVLSIAMARILFIPRALRDV